MQRGGRTGSPARLGLLLYIDKKMPIDTQGRAPARNSPECVTPGSRWGGGGGGGVGPGLAAAQGGTGVGVSVRTRTPTLPCMRRGSAHGRENTLRLWAAPRAGFPCWAGAAATPRRGCFTSTKGHQAGRLLSQKHKQHQPQAVVYVLQTRLIFVYVKCVLQMYVQINSHWLASLLSPPPPRPLGCCTTNKTDIICVICTIQMY